jgi:hypothetical protein
VLYIQFNRGAFSSGPATTAITQVKEVTPDQLPKFTEVKLTSSATSSIRPHSRNLFN